MPHHSSQSYQDGVVHAFEKVALNRKELMRHLGKRIRELDLDPDEVLQSLHTPYTPRIPKDLKRDVVSLNTQTSPTGRGQMTTPQRVADRLEEIRQADKLEYRFDGIPDKYKQFSRRRSDRIEDANIARTYPQDRIVRDPNSLRIKGVDPEPENAHLPLARLNPEKYLYRGHVAGTHTDNPQAAAWMSGFDTTAAGYTGGTSGLTRRTGAGYLNVYDPAKINPAKRGPMVPDMDTDTRRFTYQYQPDALVRKRRKRPVSDADSPWSETVMDADQVRDPMSMYKRLPDGRYLHTKGRNILADDTRISQQDKRDLLDRAIREKSHSATLRVPPEWRARFNREGGMGERGVSHNARDSRFYKGDGQMFKANKHNYMDDLRAPREYVAPQRRGPEPVDITNSDPWRSTTQSVLEPRVSKPAVTTTPTTQPAEGLSKSQLAMLGGGATLAGGGAANEVYKRKQEQSLIQRVKHHLAS